MKRIIVQSLVLMSVLFLWTGMAEASEEIVGAGQEEASIEDAQGEDLQDASDLIDEALDEELAYQKNIETEAEEASVYQENIETGAEEATLYVRAAAKSGKWVLNRTGWWFAYKDGTWPMGEIVEINGTRYGFNEAGYMVTGWYLDGSGWYYFNADGSMYSGWLLSSNTWYYLDDADVDCPGCMLSDCEKASDKKAPQSVPFQRIIPLPLPTPFLLLWSIWPRRFPMFQSLPIPSLPGTEDTAHSSGTRSADQWCCSKTGKLPAPLCAQPHRYTFHSCYSSCCALREYDTMHFIRQLIFFRIKNCLQGTIFFYASIGEDKSIFYFSAFFRDDQTSAF